MNQAWDLGRKMSHARVEPSQDHVRASKLFILAEKPNDVCVIFMRIGLLVCLVASISLALHSAFSRPPARWFPLPEYSLRPIVNLTVINSEPTNISHILFGIGGSVKTWHTRSGYSKMWWEANETRGFVWLDEKPGNFVLQGVPSYRVSEDWNMYNYLKWKPAVRIARILYESFKLGLSNVRWFVMGDDDTVFFVDNLVTLLSKYDHNEMYYIGGNSESVEQDVMHTYGMAFGGGGIAISHPLAAQLAKIFDGCLLKYQNFYGSDQRISACVNEIGVPFTLERGFHQFDIRGDPYGILAAHPMAPLVSLHHLDYLEPIFPNQSRVDSLKTLMRAYRVDSARMLQQTFCYDRRQSSSISISWGYTVQVYASLLTANVLQTPFRTFRTWGSWSEGPFAFNTRPVSSNPCKQPAMYFLEMVQEVGKSGSLTTYKRFVPKEAKKCTNPVQLDTIIVSAMKLDSDYWKHVPHRQCCEIMDRGSIKNASVRVRIRKCRTRETISI